MAKNAGTVPAYSTSEITNHHSTIINPSLAIPACQRLSKSRQKRGDCPRVLGHGAVQAVNQKGQIAGMAEVWLNDLGLKADPLAESVSLAFRTLHGFE